LDGIFRGGLPHGAVILFLGDAGSRKELFGYSFYIDGLVKGEEVVLFNTESNNQILNQRLNQALQVKAPGKEMGNYPNGIIKNIFPKSSNLYARAAAVQVLDYLDMNPEVSRVLINSFSFFARHYPMDDLIEFLRELEERACIDPFNTVVLDLADILDKRDLNNIMDKCDGVIEFVSDRVRKEQMRSLFVEKMDAEMTQEAINYDIINESILIERIDRVA